MPARSGEDRDGGAWHVSEYGITAARGGEGDGREERADSDI